MVNFDATTMNYWIIGFIVIAALAVTFAVAAVADTLLRNRRVRVARHQSIRSYYGGLVASH